MFQYRAKRKMAQLAEEQKTQNSLISVTQPKSKVTEQLRMIRTNIQYSMVDQKLKTIMFTSSGPFEGKSTISANLAAVFADQGDRVVLVDADMRKPKVADTFNMNNLAGLSTLIAGKETTLDDVTKYDATADIDIITSGPVPPNPSELLGSQRMNEIIKQLEARYDFVFFDLPPIVSVTDAQIMAAKVDGVVFVVRAHVAHKQEIKQAKQLLDVVNAKVIGAILNGDDTIGHQSPAYYEYAYVRE